MTDFSCEKHSEFYLYIYIYFFYRSATVKVSENCVLWTLDREVFKYIQAAAASAQMRNRNRWLSQCELLNKLSPLDLSRLLGLMVQVEYEKGDDMYKPLVPTNKIMVIEEGFASVYMPADLPIFSSMEVQLLRIISLSYLRS